MRRQESRQWLRHDHDVLAVARRAALRYRRAPFVVGYWRGSKLFAFNYANGVNTEVAPLLWHTLHACDEWRTAEQIQAALQISGARAADFVRALTAYGLLQRSDAPPNPADRTMSAIAEWNPAAGFFHSATRQVRFLGPAAAARLIRQRARLRPMPVPVKRLRKAPAVDLPKPREHGEFAEVLTTRRTWCAVTDAE